MQPRDGHGRAALPRAQVAGSRVLYGALDPIATLDSTAKVALLEVPCYRPHFTGGPGTYVYPERADDSRTAHLNDVFRKVAADDPSNITFVPGPPDWCTKENIATSLWHRYDGVHYTPKGASVVLAAIKQTLLSIPLSAEQHNRWR